MDVKLSKPIEHDGKKIESIKGDLEKLTGQHIIKCVREASAAKGEMVRVMVLDVDLHAEIAAEASGLPASLIRALPARDFVAVTTAVQAFLTGSD